MAGITLTLKKGIKADQAEYAHDLIQHNIGFFRYSDHRTILIDRQGAMAGSCLSRLAGELKQDIELKIELIGKVIQLKNGKRYRNTPDGWVEVADTAADMARQMCYPEDEDDRLLTQKRPRHYG